MKIEYGKYYHIFNRGTNSQKIFRGEQDYLHFLELTTIFLLPIADIYAYALMGNHFHFALRIKDENEIGFLNSKYNHSKDLDLKWKIFHTISEEDLHEYKKKPVPEKMIQHFFSSYAKWVNAKHERTGALLEHPFNRIMIENEKHLKKLIIYIHNNPVKHGFCEHPIEYGWTSYLSMVSIKPTNLARQKVIGWFTDEAKFKAIHNSGIEFKDIKHLLLE